MEKFFLPKLEFSFTLIKIFPQGGRKGEIIMTERQEFLMAKTREYLELLLDVDKYSLYPNAGELELYKSYLAELALEFPNQETLSLGIELMDMLYRAKEKADWIGAIEKLTVISLMFTGFPDDEEERSLEDTFLQED
ncbi:MAG: hypothetical protein IJT73_04775 [Selenomonadaceae bacterium]|nr:hypothetical protein [Selenomonadaceae bacterium]